MRCKRLTAVLLTLCLLLCLLPATTFAADTETVDYQYTGQYVHNRGTRGETATFLSPMAEDFYEENGVTYSDLSTLSGSDTLSDVPDSELYEALYELMDSNQTTMTSYGEVRYVSCYTDCEQNNKNQIVLFYRGTKISSKWDYGKTWQREHTWPNSKSTGGSNKISNSLRDRETDIMLLRPADPDNNMSRSNTPYGESSGYFYPNKFAVSGHNVCGDVARTILYVYVRWGGDSTYHDGALRYMWGRYGVMESKEILLKWMEEDPVDTWEMGRNDAVESITGTRNVFIDYPELAFALFDEEVPADKTTPTGVLECHVYDDGVDGTCNLCGVHRETTEERTVMHMFRMYDPNSGEHFYTGSEVERDNLVEAGWNYEGVGFTFSMTTGAPVYRLYDRNDTCEHLYTMDEEEKERLMAEGWELEGIAFNSAYDTEVPQYRLHNPNAKRGAYHFTASAEERDNLIAAGWEYQGIGFYSSWN